VVFHALDQYRPERGLGVAFSIPSRPELAARLGRKRPEIGRLEPAGDGGSSADDPVWGTEGGGSSLLPGRDL
jgi:hypothetical protein